MALPLEVNWVDQAEDADAHERIRQIGGDSGQLRWKHTQTQAIESIERGLFSFYLKVKGRTIRLNVGLTASGKKFLTVDAPDGQPQLQHLAELPPFPKS